MMPTRLILELNSQCELQCRYCSTASGPRGGVGPTVHFWSRVVEEFAALGGQEVVLSGGEPFLYPGLFALLRLAGRLRTPRVAVLSNGLVADPWVVRELAGSGAMVWVSLDSRTADQHDALRGAGTHARALTGLERLREGLPGFRLGIAATATREGLTGLAELARWTAQEGLGRFLWAEVAPLGRARFVPDLVPPPAEVAAARSALLHLGVELAAQGALMEYWGEGEGEEPAAAVRVAPTGDVFRGRGPGAAEPLDNLRERGLGHVLLRPAGQPRRQGNRGA